MLISEALIFVHRRARMIPLRRHRDRSDNSQFRAGDSWALAPCPLCLTGEVPCDIASMPRFGQQSQMAVAGSRWEDRCTNKANLLRAPGNGRGTARSPLPAPPGASVRNEANLAVWPLAPNKANSGQPDRHPGVDCAKQTQFAPERFDGQVLYGPRFMVNCTRNGCRQNKANSRRSQRGTRGNRAKQTQFAPEQQEGQVLHR
jgi:hypothetical protein